MYSDGKVLRLSAISSVHVHVCAQEGGSRSCIDISIAIIVGIAVLVSV